jgi:hypothetical protein
VLYWLSRDGWECVKIDHTGLDLLARNRHTGELMGISVKSRSRFPGTETGAVSLPTKDFAKVEAACAAFGCAPYYAIVVDGGGWLRIYLTSLARLKDVATAGVGKVHWQMTQKDVDRYKKESGIWSVEMQVTHTSWWADSKDK